MTTPVGEGTSESAAAYVQDPGEITSESSDGKTWRKAAGEAFGNIAHAVIRGVGWPSWKPLPRNIRVLSSHDKSESPLPQGRSYPKSRLLELKNGTTVPEELLQHVFLQLKDLLNNQPIALIELVKICRNEGHKPFGNNGELLKELKLLDSNYQPASVEIKNIVLSAAKGESLLGFSISWPLKADHIDPFVFRLLEGFIAKKESDLLRGLIEACKNENHELPPDIATKLANLQLLDHSGSPIKGARKTINSLDMSLSWWLLNESLENRESVIDPSALLKLELLMLKGRFVALKELSRTCKDKSYKPPARVAKELHTLGLLDSQNRPTEKVKNTVVSVVQDNGSIVWPSLVSEGN